MPTIAETTYTDTKSSDITINLAKNQDQFAMNSENVEEGQFTFITNSAGTAPGEPLRFNVFPNETAYSEAINENALGWNDVSVTYEDTDFVIRNCMYIRFWDYDGTLAYKYNIDEFLTLDEMPPLPVHTDKNLVCDGWNWTYDEILEYLKDNPSDIDVGTTASSLGNPSTADAKVIFMNHAGGTVAEMTAAEFISNGMPPLPNLGSFNRVADSWNWTQAEIEQQLAEVGGEIYVGCIAHPYTNVGLGDTCVRFWDYDGTLVYECTGVYFINDPTMPADPDHSKDSIPLVNCGWNWNVDEIINHLRTLDTNVNVGAVYHTKDGYTHIIAKPTMAYPTAKIYLKPSIANDVTVDWGDHTYDTWTSTSASIKTHTYNISDGDTFDITIKNSSGTYTFTANLASNVTEAKNCKYTAIFLGENARLQNVTDLFSNNYDLETFVFWDEAGVSANVNTLGSRIFQYDYHLKCAILPKNVTTYSNNTFDSCYSLETVCMPPNAGNYTNSMFYNGYSLVNVTIPDSVGSLGNYCFYNCESIPDTLVPVTVKDFGSWCFYGCRSLTYMELGEGTNTVGPNCFYGCSRITPAIIIPHDTDMSGNETYLFYGCVSLNHISLPFSYKFKTDDTYFMYNCMSVDGVTIPYGSTAVPASSFRMCCHLGRTVIPYGVTDIGSTAFSNSVADRIEMPATVKNIQGSLLYYATAQNHITIPRNVTQLEGTYTFASAYGLTSISLPPGITVYGNYTTNDTLIPRFTLSDAITAIPANMFTGNAGRICTLTIPKTVSSIANSAISAPLLVRVYCMSETPPTLGTSNFGGMASYGKIYVPSGYGDIYKSASNWSSNSISSRIVEYNPSLTSGTLSYTEPKPKNAAIDTEPSYEIHKTANTKNIHMLFGPESGIYGEDNLNVRFYNWDGSLLYAFPGDYFSQNNSLLPDPPDNSDENLNTYKWNWTANAISAVLNDDPYAHIDVGVECTTKDELTHIIFEPATDAMTAKIALKPDVANSVTVDWGDGHTDTWSSTTNTVKTHTYEEIPATGSYDITIESSDYYSFTTYITGSTTDNAECRYTDIRMSGFVKAYGGNTFRNCKYLKTVILGTAEVSGANILQYAFTECASLRYIAIPSTMNYLGSYAFTGDCSLETVSLPYNLKNIGTYAFQSCISLKHVTINEEEPSTYQYMFIYCHNLEHVYISPYATSIGNYAFNGCVSLKKLKIPSKVTSIGSNAFDNCVSLKEIFIPKNVESIGQYAFQNSCLLETVEFEAGGGLTTIGQNAFNRCANLTEINIPDTVTSMGTTCFGDCRKLETVHLPDNSSFTNIPGYTFYGCKRLKEITVPGKITSIGNNAFQNCNSLNAVTFYSNTISFGNNCFHQCYALKYLNGAASISGVGTYCFNDCWSLRSIDISDITDVPNYCFYSCYSLLDVTFGKPETIGDYAFNNCFNLRMNEFPDTIITIGKNAFAGCHNIKNVSTEARSIDINAFAQCLSLDTISVTGVTAVPNSMCNGAYAPRTAIIGKGVTSIGTNVFQNCPSLREIYCYPTSPPTLASTNSIPTNSYLTIYVPHGSLWSYQSAQNWSTFASKIFDIL